MRQVVTDANNPPPPTPVSLQNASLESDSNGDGFPDCWRKGDVGVATVVSRGPAMRTPARGLSA